MVLGQVHAVCIPSGVDLSGPTFTDKGKKFEQDDECYLALVWLARLGADRSTDFSWLHPFSLATSKGRAEIGVSVQRCGEQKEI
jgi:hypothetical protein